MNAKKVTPAKYQPEATSSKFTYILGGIAVIVVAVLVIGGVLWTSGGSDARNDGYGAVSGADVAVTLEDGGSILVGTPDAGTTIDVFEDPLCPYCGEFEHKFGQELAQSVDEGDLAVRFHMLAFLDPRSDSGDYSTRAVAAAQCVAETGDAGAFWTFHAEIMSPDTQPAPGGSSDHDNAALAQMARDAGASEEAAACIENGSGVEQARASSDAGRELLATTGAEGTPAVVHGDTVIDALGNDNWLVELVG